MRNEPSKDVCHHTAGVCRGDSLWAGKAWDRNGNCPTVHIQAASTGEGNQMHEMFEGWHGEKKHWPYVGWGHKVLTEESFTNDITKAQGDSILRADMMKLCRLFSRFGRDSILLSCLAYQVGPYRLLGSKDLPKSKLIQKLEAGNRDIYKEYISFRCYKGKVVPSIERRRKVEYLLLFEE